MLNSQSFARLLLASVILLTSNIKGTDQQVPGWNQLSSEEAAHALRSCYNSKYNASIGASFQNYADGVMTQSIRIHRIWWSKREPKLPLTIFTTADLTRLNALEAQCRSFPGGTISAAVYVPFFENSTDGIPSGALSMEHFADLYNITSRLDAFFASLETTPTLRDPAFMWPMGMAGAEASAAEASQPCSLRMILTYEIVPEEAMTAIFPVNVLRNLAVLGATTPLISMVDVDLEVNIGLSERILSNQTRVAELLRQAEQVPVVWIMPAWATHHRLSDDEGKRVADAVARLRYEEKPQLMTLWNETKKIYPFHFDVYKFGHNATKYDKWFATDTDYPVNYTWGYEPWFMAARTRLPYYDSRFRGYSLNKISQLEYMNYTGFRFRVLPDVWIIHRPHQPTATCTICNLQSVLKTHGADAVSKLVTFKGQQVVAREANRERSAIFHNDFVRHFRWSHYTPIEDPASQHCRSVLPWWQ